VKDIKLTDQDFLFHGVKLNLVIIPLFPLTLVIVSVDILPDLFVDKHLVIIHCKLRVWIVLTMLWILTFNHIYYLVLYPSGYIGLRTLLIWIRNAPRSILLILIIQNHGPIIKMMMYYLIFLGHPILNLIILNLNLIHGPLFNPRRNVSKCYLFYYTSTICSSEQS